MRRRNFTLGLECLVSAAGLFGPRKARASQTLDKRRPSAILTTDKRLTSEQIAELRDPGTSRRETCTQAASRS